MTPSAIRALGNRNNSASETSKGTVTIRNRLSSLRCRFNRFILALNQPLEPLSALHASAAPPPALSQRPREATTAGTRPGGAAAAPAGPGGTPASRPRRNGRAAAPARRGPDRSRGRPPPGAARPEAPHRPPGGPQRAVPGTEPGPAAAPRQRRGARNPSEPGPRGRGRALAAAPCPHLRSPQPPPPPAICRPPPPPPGTSGPRPEVGAGKPGRAEWERASRDAPPLSPAFFSIRHAPFFHRPRPLPRGGGWPLKGQQRGGRAQSSASCPARPPGPGFGAQRCSWGARSKAGGVQSTAPASSAPSTREGAPGLPGAARGVWGFPVILPSTFFKTLKKKFRGKEGPALFGLHLLLW